jgi:hypothetical protein
MGIKSFFRNLGRGIKRGFEKFVSGAGNALGGAATFLQQKAIPAIASGATKAAGLLDKAAPLLDAAGPEAAAAGAEASDVAKQVGAGVGKFATFIGSNAPKGRMATAAEVQQFRSQIPQGKSFFGIKPLPAELPPAAPTKPAPALVPAVMPAKPNPLKALGDKINRIGSNPASYSPTGIEAKPANQDGSIKVAGGGGSGPAMLSM